MSPLSHLKYLNYLKEENSPQTRITPLAGASELSKIRAFRGVIMSRSLRRHHRARLKKNRRHYWGRDMLHEEKYLSMAVDTPATCSCWMCANPRRSQGELTIQERRALAG